MTAAADEGAPIIRSIAFVTVSLVMVTTCAIGALHWVGQGEYVMAIVVVAMEIWSGLMFPLASRQWQAGRLGCALLAIGLGVITAGFCASTTWHVLQSDALTRAAAQIEASATYRAARRDEERAAARLDEALASTAPACTCPATIAAWRVAQAERVGQLEAIRADAQNRLDALAPSSAIDPLTLLRAVAMEAVKLFGLLASSSAPAIAKPKMNSRSTRLRRRVLSGVLGAIGLGAQSGDRPKAPSAYERPAVADLEGPKRRKGGISAPTTAAPATRIEKIARARALLTAGLPKTAIARELGVCRNTVGNWLGPTRGKPIRVPRTAHTVRNIRRPARSYKTDKGA